MKIDTSNQPWLIFFQGLLIGSLGLSLFYYLILFIITGDSNHPLTQFAQFQPWMSLLIIGFAIQMGLFRLMRKGIRFNLREKQDSQIAAGTGSALSGLAMVACCTHHAADLLPIMGLSAAALFLSEYREQLLVLGVLSNLAGISLMLWFFSGQPKIATLYNYVSRKIKTAL